MNLLEMLLSSMTTDSSTESVAKKTGLNGTAIRYLLSLAVPVLIKYMTQNASTANGAQSLLGALTQHNSQKSIAAQVDEADDADGSKIISHILGNDEETVVRGLAKQSGLTTLAVKAVLSAIAPALLSGLSAATNQKKKKESDLGSLISLFTGAQSKPQTTGVESLLGALFNSGASQTASNTVPLTQTQSAGNGMGALLGTLLGGAQSAQAVQQDTSVNGAQLLNVLAALMK